MKKIDLALIPKKYLLFANCLSVCHFSQNEAIVSIRSGKYASITDNSHITTNLVLIPAARLLASSLTFAIAYLIIPFCSWSEWLHVLSLPGLKKQSLIPAREMQRFRGQIDTLLPGMI